MSAPLTPSPGALAMGSPYASLREVPCIARKTSPTHNFKSARSTPRSQTPQTAHTKPVTRKTAKRAPLTWQQWLAADDAASLWCALHRLVTIHPLARAALSGQQGDVNPTPSASTADLTQDLFLVLLQKHRFQHYRQTRMSDAEIEREIFQVELSNLLIGNLRRRRPENYRLVRRVSQMLEHDPRFRRFRRAGREGALPERYRQAAEAVYGLRAWSDGKPRRDAGTFDARVAAIPTRRRDLRRAGCAGDTQVIISNEELGRLLVELLEAIDSPAPLRVLRQLALAKLPVCDAEMSSLDAEVDNDMGAWRARWLTAPDPGPEQRLLAEEDARGARRAAGAFLDQLSQLTRAHRERTERLWRVLWHCYFDAAEPSQLEIAAALGISDSSISDYRRKLEAALRALDLQPDQVAAFTEALAAQLRRRLGLPSQTAAPSSL